MKRGDRVLVVDDLLATGTNPSSSIYPHNIDNLENGIKLILFNLDKAYFFIWFAVILRKKPCGQLSFITHLKGSGRKNVQTWEKKGRVALIYSIC